MSKAILIIDMPESCSKCRFFREVDIAKGCCEITDSPSDNTLCRYVDVAFSYEKPDWCPLKFMPERKNEDTTFYDSDYHTAVGYNACIEDILCN